MEKPVDSVHKLRFYYDPRAMVNPYGYTCTCGASSMNRTHADAIVSYDAHERYAQEFPNGPIQKGPIPVDKSVQPGAK